MLAVLIVVTVLGSVIGTAISTAGVFFPGFIVRDGQASQTARVFALYAIARSVPLLAVILWAAFRADATALLWLGTLAGLIQLADAAVGLQAGKTSAIWGPLGVGVVQLSVVALALGLL